MTAEILCAIEEERDLNSKELAKKLGVPMDQLERILHEMMKKNVIEYNRQTGKVKLSRWIARLSKELENTKPAAGTIILPRNQEIKLQDILVGNFTGADLELMVRLKTNRKEIAICTVT
jgi:DNA-binding transcriptional regulator YhcF (GntR family)